MDSNSSSKPSAMRERYQSSQQRNTGNDWPKNYVDYDSYEMRDSRANQAQTPNSIRQVNKSNQSFSRERGQESVIMDKQRQISTNRPQTSAEIENMISTEEIIEKSKTQLQELMDMAEKNRLSEKEEALAQREMIDVVTKRKFRQKINFTKDDKKNKTFLTQIPRIDSILSGPRSGAVPFYPKFKPKEMETKVETPNKIKIPKKEDKEEKPRSNIDIKPKVDVHDIPPPLTNYHFIDYSSFPESKVDEILAIRQSGSVQEVLIKLKRQSYFNTKWVLESDLSSPLYYGANQIIQIAKSFNSIVYKQPYFNSKFKSPQKVLERLDNEKGTRFLVKWKALPLPYSTYESIEENDQMVLNYELYKRQRSPRHFEYHPIEIDPKYCLSKEQTSAVNSIFQCYCANDSSNAKCALIGQIGSIMRRQIAALIDAICVNAEVLGPFLYICEDKMVDLIALELEHALNRNVIAVPNELSTISFIKDHCWVNHEQNLPKFSVAVLSIDALVEMQKALQTIDWVLAIYDATDSIGEDLADYLKNNCQSDNEESSGYDTPDNILLANIFDYLVKNIGLPYFQIAMLPSNITDKETKQFIQSHDDVTRLHHELTIFCPLTDIQRVKYNDIITEKIEDAFSFKSNDDQCEPLTQPLKQNVIHPSLLEILQWARKTQHVEDPQTRIKKASEFERLAEESCKMRFIFSLIKRTIEEKKTTMFLSTDKAFFNFIKAYLKILNSYFVEMSEIPRSEPEETSQLTMTERFFLVKFTNRPIDYIQLKLDYIVVIDPWINPTHFLPKDVSSDDHAPITLFRLISPDTYELFMAIDLTNPIGKPKRTTLDFATDYYRLPLRYHFKTIPKQRNEPSLLKWMSSMTRLNKINKNAHLSFVPRIISYPSPLHVSPNDFIVNWNTNLMHSLLVVMSKFCWGRWESMCKEFLSDIRADEMMECSYIMLTTLLKRTDKRFVVLERIIELYDTRLEETQYVHLTRIFDEFCYGTESSKLKARLKRIEQLALISIIISNSRDFEIPNPEKKLPNSKWSEQNDQELINYIYDNGYGSYKADEHRIPSRLISERLEIILDEFKNRLLESDARQVSNDQQSRSRITIRTSSPEWTKHEEFQVIRAMINFGRKIPNESIRKLLNSHDRNDQEISLLRGRINKYIKSEGTDQAFGLNILPPRKLLSEAIEFFQHFDKINLAPYYEEDRCVIETVIHHGLSHCPHSFLLYSMFGKKSVSFYKKKVIELIQNPHKLIPEGSSIEYDTLEGNIPKLPLMAANNIRIKNFGKIKMNADAFHNSSHIYPTGYVAEVNYYGNDVICKIIDGDNSPMFSVGLANSHGGASQGQTPEQAWCSFLTNVLSIDPSSYDVWKTPGHEYFGLTSPIVKRIIQAMPNAISCKKYKPVSFNTPISYLKNNHIFIEGNDEEEDTEDEQDSSKPRKNLSDKRQLKFDFSPLFHKIVPQDVSINHDKLTLPSTSVLLYADMNLYQNDFSETVDSIFRSFAYFDPITET